MINRLTEAELDAALRQHPDWRRDGDAIVRVLRFADFATAFAFMTEVAFAAERADHHPDWQNVYRDVTIRLSTHEAGGLTGRDFALAGRIDAAARRHGVAAA